jgi:D-aspartate ligase
MPFRFRNPKNAQNSRVRKRVVALLPSLDTKYPALILKASRGIIHHGALGVARTLGRAGVPVYAIVDDACAPLARSRYLTKAFVWESWPSDRKALLSAISTIGEVIGHPAILIPTDDLSAVFVAENASALDRWFLCPLPPSDLPQRLANKASLYSLCADIGVPCARSVTLSSADDVREFIKDFKFPIVVKAAEQWVLLNNRFSTVVLHTHNDFLEFYKGVNGEHSPTLILQEYIAGDDWIYHGYCNAETNLYLGFTGKKLLSYPPDAGSTALGISVHNDALRSQTEMFLKAISYSGIVDIDWRRDRRDGQYKMMDCNPRVGQNFRMFENTAGIDVIRAQHLDLTGRSIDCSEMIEGRIFTVETFYLLSSLRGFRSVLTTKAHLHPRPGSRELAWWSSDDQLPFFVMGMRLLLRAINRTFRGIRDTKNVLTCH